jgi:hypothetical protein
MNNYKKSFKVDTVIHIGTDTLEVMFMHYSLNDSSVVIPKEYIWTDKHLDSFVVSNSESSIKIMKNGNLLYSEVFGKEKFDTLLTSTLRKYAVMMSPKFRGLNTSKNKLVFAYSISIPITDIGTSAILHVNLNGKSWVTEYDF